MKYKPQIGTEFPISKEVVAARTHQTELTRSTIALVLVLFSGLALAITAIVCVYRGEFQMLVILWAVLSPPLAVIVFHYFQSRNIDGKINDESPT
jgi:hypothetical protein